MQTEYDTWKAEWARVERARRRTVAKALAQHAPQPLPRMGALEAFLILAPLALVVGMAIAWSLL